MRTRCGLHCLFVLIHLLDCDIVINLFINECDLIHRIVCPVEFVKGISTRQTAEIPVELTRVADAAL